MCKGLGTQLLVEERDAVACEEHLAGNIRRYAVGVGDFKVTNLVPIQSPFATFC